MEETIRREIQRMFKSEQSQYPYRNCLNCTNWNFDMDGCNRFKAKPPTEIIVYSCEQWEEERIPF